MSTFTIRKLDALGRQVLQYPGRVLARSATTVTLEAVFGRPERVDLGYTVFEPGDRFVEHFYADRWYNVFAVYAARDGRFRGWYCNITRPAVIEADGLSAMDLALDLWVTPDYSLLVLDEDEFAALELSDGDRAAARAALAELQTLARRGDGPFAHR
jgi:hypothetical protein